MRVYIYILLVLFTVAQRLSILISITRKTHRMFERRNMFKQLQELQMQKKPQELNDFREQNVRNQLSLMCDKQSSGAQFGVLNTGIRVRDPSEMFVFGDTKWIQGFSNKFTDSRFKSPFQESAGVSTKNRSQQDGIFGKSFMSNQSSGSVDQKLSSKEDGNSLGTENFRNMFEKIENSSKFCSIRNANSSVLMQSAEASSSDVNQLSNDKFPHSHFGNLKTGGCGPNSSGNMFKLLQKVEEENTHMVSVNQVPKSESDDAFAPSYDNKNNASHSPYVSLMLTTKSQSPKSEKDQLPNQNCMASDLVSVKNEDGQRWSTGPANIQLDALVQQKTSVMGSCELPSTSNAAKGSTRNQSSPHLQILDKPNQKTGSLKSKKRKCSTFKRLPPRPKKVTKGPSRLHDISTAELEWAHSTVRLPEKLNPEEPADSCWITNGKIRLSLSTRLMQLLFQPPPADVLSEDAITHCDTVTYYASKSAPGDACRLRLPAGKNMTSKSSSDQDLIKIIEGFIDRSKRLENDVLRLEKSGSSLFEVKMDSQDLEKFSFINRFAKFHKRRPTVTSDTSSTTRKPYLERYVTAIPMPETVPEGQDCLFL